MNYSKERKIIENRISTLQDKVADHLRIEKDVDKFLDNTTLLDEWETFDAKVYRLNIDLYPKIQLIF